ncbi:glycoside hydrolase domain-containing protein [Candidatus Omnitrophota bacterium]
MDNRKVLIGIILIIVLLSALQERVYGEPKVDLLDISVTPSELFTGDTLLIKCSLSVTEKLKGSYFLFLHLEGSGPGAYVNADIHSLNGARHWEPNERMDLGPFYVYVPFDLPQGEYKVTMGLSSPTKTQTGTRYKKIPYTDPGKKYWVVAKIKVKKRPAASVPAADGRDYSFAVEGSTKKVFREKERLDIAGAETNISLHAAKGEYEAFQIVLIPEGRGLKDVDIRVSDLILEGGSGSSIGKENVSLYKVGYVRTKKPYYNTINVGLWPDPLIPLKEAVSVKKGDCQPIWVSVFIPHGASAGRYRGKIEIRPSEGSAEHLDVELRVYNFSIPKRPSLRTAFDFYEYVVGKRHPRRKHEHEVFWKIRVNNLVEKYYLSMLKHRISPIHNVGNPEFLREENGEYMLDFEEFDEKVEFYLRKGQSCFGIGKEWPFKYEGDWTDKWYGFTDEEAVVGVFSAYGRHLEEKGWQSLAYAYIFDETFHRVKEITGLIHEGNAGIRNLLTMTPAEGYPDVDIWCVRINNFSQPIVEDFRKDGKDIWMYIAGTTRPFPNLNLDVPAIEHRIIPWMCWKYKVGGLLYWCVNWWGKTDPWENPMNFSEQNGNGSLYYPDPEGEEPIGSIRLEVLRDGLEDYEYLYALDKEIKRLKESGPSSYGDIIEKAEEALAIDPSIINSLTYYTRDAGLLDEKRIKIGEMIEAIDDINRLNKTMPQ